MKLTFDPHFIRAQFAGGGESSIRISEIISIDLQTMATMTVDVDLICLSHESGEFLEISDDAVGFSEVCDYLSEALQIAPPLRELFPVAEGHSIKAYERKANGA